MRLSLFSLSLFIASIAAANAAKSIPGGDDAQGLFAQSPATDVDFKLVPGKVRTFEIGTRDFLLDEKPFVIRCGEIHFARVPREYWRQRLQMCRALGLNTVCVYLFWNFHEWEEGKFNWSGPADVAEFCRLAQEEGLWVLLRPGPYSCAEWEMGGLPWWLLRNEGIALRSSDPKFVGPATRYLKEVGRVLKSQQVTHGGPLLMVQVENEYGSYGEDTNYMGMMRQALLDGGFDVPLFACDPTWAITRAYRPDLFQVVNFGPGNAEKAFEALAKLQKTGPLMNGEYYPAWFDMWGRKHRTGAIEPLVADLEYMLTHRRSFSIYMAHGGTTFGMWSGADRPFSPDTSSYDYDAPISEAGWVTPKFKAIREVMARHLQPGEGIPLPSPAALLIEIAPITLGQNAAMLENLPKPILRDEPATMEALGQSRGGMLYRTTLPAGPAGHIEAQAVHDFAWVTLDDEAIGVMDRRAQRYRVPVPARTKPMQLDFFLATMGRVNFGVEVHDRKGIHGPIRFVPSDGSTVNLRGWRIYSFLLDQAQLESLKFGLAKKISGPAFWRGELKVEKAGDTFLDLRGWGKGVVWVNGHCLGRFWNIGPTQTMYLPGTWLKPGSNEVIVYDLLGPKSPQLAGLKEPILDELHADLDFSRSQRATGVFAAGDLPPVAKGRLSGGTKSQEVRFAAQSGRYLCFMALTTIGESSLVSLAELDFLDTAGLVMSKASCRVLWADSEELNAAPGAAENMIDGQTSSFWQSQTALPMPCRVVIDLGRTETIAGLRLVQRGGNSKAVGHVRDYEVYFSNAPFGLLRP